MIGTLGGHRNRSITRPGSTTDGQTSLVLTHHLSGIRSLAPSEACASPRSPGNVHAYGITRGQPPIVYFPVAQTPEDFSMYIVRNPFAWIIRTRQEPRILQLAIQRELSKASGGLAVSSVQAIDDVVARSMASRE